MEVVDAKPAVLSQGPGSADDDFQPRIVEELAQDAQEFAQVVEQCKQNATVHTDVANACVTLYNTQSAQPSELELSLTHLLLSQCGSKKPVVIHAIIIASVKWNTVDLWAKTVQFCCAQGTVSLVRAQWVVLAIQKFGFGQVQPMLQYMLALKTTVRPLIGLFDEVLALKDRQGAGYLPRDAIEWILERRRELCVKIERSAKDNCDKLIHECLVKGGIEYMHEHILPVCKHASAEMFLRALALRIHQDEAFTESSTKRRVVAELIMAAIAKTNVLSAKKDKDSMTPAQTLLRLCIDTNCDEAGALAVKKLCDTRKLDNPTSRLDRMNFLITLLSWLVDNLKPADGTPSFVKLLLSGANDHYIAYLISQLELDTADQISTSDLKPLLRVSGGAGSLLASLSSKLDKIGCEYLPSILKFVKPQYQKIFENHNMTEHLKTIFGYFAENIDLDPSAELEDVMAYIDPCIDARLPESTSLVIDKVVKHLCAPSIHWCFDAQEGELVEQHSKGELEYLLEQLTAKARSQKGMDVVVGPGMCAVIKAWIQADCEDPNVIPTAGFLSDQERMRAKWLTEEGCTCATCDEIFNFLTGNDRHAIMDVVRLETKGKTDSNRSVKHVNRTLGSLVTSEIATWTFEPRPEPDVHLQDLWIFKSHQLYRPSYSPEFKQRVEELITMAAGKDEADRARILGHGYEEVKHWMDGPHLRTQQETEPALGEKRTAGEEEAKEPEQPPKRRRTRNSAA